MVDDSPGICFVVDDEGVSFLMNLGFEFVHEEGGFLSLGFVLDNLIPEMIFVEEVALKDGLFRIEFFIAHGLVYINNMLIMNQLRLFFYRYSRYLGYFCSNYFLFRSYFSFTFSLSRAFFSSTVN